MYQMENIPEKLSEAKRFIESEIDGFTPEIGLILGSGLGFFADYLESSTRISYGAISGFPVSTVSGHEGKLVFGSLYKKKIVAMQGRIHFYEGYSMKEVTYPVRLMKELGVETLIVTNASGGVNPDFRAGDLMLIIDHINFTGTNPAIGDAEEGGYPRFFDMTEAYDKEYRITAKEVAKELDLELKEGIYFGGTGPSYETPAEIRMIRTLGGDAVGMSTVPEVIVARKLGIRVCGISCITNLAAGISKTKLNHDEVKETAEKVKPVFIKLLENLIKRI